MPQRSATLTVAAGTVSISLGGWLNTLSIQNRNSGVGETLTVVLEPDSGVPGSTVLDPGTALDVGPEDTSASAGGKINTQRITLTAAVATISYEMVWTFKNPRDMREPVTV